MPLNTVLNGTYQIGHILGQGGFGLTYLAFDTALHKVVAIKEFLPTNLVSRANNDNTLTPHSTDHATEFQRGVRGDGTRRHEATLHEARSARSKEERFYASFGIFSSEETPEKLIADIKDL